MLFSSHSVSKLHPYICIMTFQCQRITAYIMLHNSFASFSVRNDHCDLSTNSKFVSVCEPVPATVPIAFFSRHVEFLIKWWEVKAVSVTVSV